MSAELTIAEIQRQVRELKDAKGFDITLEQRLAYLKETFYKKASLNEGREW